MIILKEIASLLNKHYRILVQRSFLWKWDINIDHEEMAGFLQSRKKDGQHARHRGPCMHKGLYGDGEVLGREEGRKPKPGIRLVRPEEAASLFCRLSDSSLQESTPVNGQQGVRQ